MSHGLSLNPPLQVGLCELPSTSQHEQEHQSRLGQSHRTELSWAIGDRNLLLFAISEIKVVKSSSEDLPEFDRSRHIHHLASPV